MLLGVTGALAAGFTVPTSGVVGIGRGGAWVAGVDDLTAQGINPAALSRIDHDVMLQLAATDARVTFDRADEGSDVFAPVSDTAGPLTSPNVAWGKRFGPVTVAVGAWTPYGPRLAFDTNGPQRFTLTEMTVLSGKAGPSIAWQATDTLSLGAGGAWTFVHVDQELVAHLAPLSFQPDDNPDYDVVTRITASDFRELTWNAGLLWDTGRFAVGASYLPRITYEPTGSMTSDFSRNIYATDDSPFGKVIANDTATDPDVAMTVVLPPTARLGVLFRPSATVEVEANVVWERWGVMPPLSVTELDLVVETTLPEDPVITEPVTLPMDTKDAWSVHLGGAWQVADDWEARAGVFGETSAVTPEYRSVMLPDGNKLGYGLGASRHRDGLSIDVGWQHAITPKTERDDSWVTQVQIDPQTGEVGIGKLVGDGDLGGHTFVLGAGFTWTPGD
ncbi:MAG: hypothetical protein GY913_28450 [Proteobacteria bacterium]|nr:hypothetical protein [Pseudomonadota bacterium]